MREPVVIVRGVEELRTSTARARLAWFLVVAVYACLAFAYVLPDLGEASHLGNVLMWLAFAGRTFTFQAGLGLLAVLVWMRLCRLRRPALAMLPILGISLGPAVWSCIPKSPVPLGPNAITVMSCNLLIGSQSPALAAEQIAHHDPDIVFFQEYSDRAHAAIEPVLRGKYPYIITASRNDAFGQAIYSKLEPIGTPMLYPPPSLGAGARTGGVVNLGDPQIRMIVRVGEREVVLQNVHTVPPGGATLLAEQRKMLRWLAQFVREERRPVVMAGDFNATAASLGVLHDAGLTNTHALAGQGRGSTWPDVTWLRYLPGVRIDNIFVSDGLSCDRAEVGKSIGSDHRPIIARVGFTE